MTDIKVKRTYPYLFLFILDLFSYVVHLPSTTACLSANRDSVIPSILSFVHPSTCTLLAVAEFELTHVDEFIDELLHEERVCDIILPRLQVRRQAYQLHILTCTMIMTSVFYIFWRKLLNLHVASLACSDLHLIVRVAATL